MMVRLADLHPADAKAQMDKIPALAGFGEHWVTPPPLAKARIAIVTTAGLHRRGDRPFGPSAKSTDYRIIPGATPASELVMSHQSVNFDRSGFQEDHNVVFPIDRLNELARSSTVGSVAEYHYAFMGAAPIRELQPKAAELAGLLKQDSVDAVLLSPV
jgi:D-proline reductase (dithiol) PrdB